MATKSTQDTDYDIANALKSTVLIFSNTHYEMDEAKDVFWFELSLLSPTLSGQQPPPQWETHKMERTWRQGSGILIDKNGYILTNRNIIEDCTDPCGYSLGIVGSGAQLIYVFVPDENGSVNIEQGREYIATVICKHPQDDLAVIKITPRDGVFPYCAIGDSDLIKRMQRVFIFGYSSDILYAQSLSAYKWKTGTIGFTCEPTITDGVVSSKLKLDTYPVNYMMEELSADYSVNVIQTNAAINYGSRGGPLMDANGQIIGIAGLGFAIAINDAKDLIKSALARPIDGIKDGAFLSCVDKGYCCSQSAWEANPARRCIQLCDKYYGTAEARAKCFQRCENNLGEVQASTSISKSTSEKPIVNGYKYNNEEYGFSVIHPFDWNTAPCSPPLIYTAVSSAGVPSISVSLFNKDKFKEEIGDLLAYQGGGNFIWQDYPEYVQLNDGKTEGKFYLIKWNFLSRPFKTLILTVNIPNNKIISAWCTTDEPAYYEDRFKEILFTFTVSKPSAIDK